MNDERRRKTPQRLWSSSRYTCSLGDTAAGGRRTPSEAATSVFLTNILFIRRRDLMDAMLAPRVGEFTAFMSRWVLLMTRCRQFILFTKESRRRCPFCTFFKTRAQSKNSGLLFNGSTNELTTDTWTISRSLHSGIRRSYNCSEIRQMALAVDANFACS